MSYSTFVQEQSKGKNKTPEWQLTSFLDNDTGEVFLPPGVIGMTEMNAVMCAGYDGTDMLLRKNHVYVSVEWLKQEKPELAEWLDRITAKIKQAHANS